MKTKRIIVLFSLIILILFNINFIYATETEIEESSESEVAEISTEDATEETSDDIVEDLPTTDFLGTGITEVSTVNSISEMNLKINNVLNIILIAIGVLLILFAIAILIRLKS